MPYYVYILRSCKDGKRYIGFTRNIANRLSQHNSGKVLSTKNRRPFELIGYRRFETLQEAVRYEKRLKHR